MGVHPGQRGSPHRLGGATQVQGRLEQVGSPGGRGPSYKGPEEGHRDIGNHRRASSPRTPRRCLHTHWAAHRIHELNTRAGQERRPVSTKRAKAGSASASLDVATTYRRTDIRYVLKYIRTYLHTYIRTYVHTYIRTCVHTYIRTYVHTYCRGMECRPTL